MEAIMKALEDFEKLIYKILVWIVLIPKTLLQVMLHPEWATSYLKQELGDGKPRFDEYFSPVVLLLFVAVLPFLLWNFLPVPGVEITSPATENPTAAHTVDFDANIKFISTSTSGWVTTFWRVEQEFYDGASQSYRYPVLYHNRYTNNPTEVGSLEYYNYKQIDNHTIQDFYSVDFPGSGNYWVVLDASKFDSRGDLLETYSSEIHIYVPPEDSQQNVIVYARTKPDERKPLIESLGTQLKSEKTIFLALGLLIPPLLFTLAIKMLVKGPLSEDSLKETFYVQCYYFAPIAFVFWATRYAIQLFTPDVFFRYDTDLNLIVLLPMILAIFWFISVQTHLVSKEGNTSAGLALLVVLVCMFILGAGASFIIFNNQPDLQDVTRKSSMWLYSLLAVGLLTTYHILSILQKRREKLAISTGDKILVGGIVFIIFVTMCLVLVVGGRATPLASADFDATQQFYVADSIDPSFQAKKFYTEEFDGNIDDWLPYFMTSGDASQVNLHTENSNLVFQLSQLEDQIPIAYLINNAFLYTDVQVEVGATNKDENPSSVTLICRYSGGSWYEFEVSNSGAFAIYAFDSNKGYTQLTSGVSAPINTDSSKNTFVAICQGNELTLNVNDSTVTSIQDTTFNFAEGAIGIAVSSLEGSAVEVDFDYIEVSEPPAKEEAPALEAVASPMETTEAVATEVAMPTVTPAPEAQSYYTEEFDGDLASWVPYMAIGDESQVIRSVQDGNLVYHLDPSDGNIPTTYLQNIEFTYTDVKLDLVTTNIGNNANDVILVCRFSDVGWYEFDVSNSGIYSIYAVDAKGAVQQGYNELSSGNSASIRVGHSTNTYTGVCKGNELSLYVNGDLVDTIQDTTFKFAEGNIAIGVSAFQPLPIDLSIDSLTVSAP